MKYFRSKLLIVLCTALATIGVWAALAWPAWHAGTPNSAASAVVEPVATAAPPPTPDPAPITPQPVAPPEPPVVVRRIVYVPRSPADSTSAAVGQVDAVPAAASGAEPPPGAAPSVPAAAPAAAPAAPAQPQPDPAPAPAPQPVAPRQPPAPVKTAPPAPAPTPIKSGGS